MSIKLLKGKSGKSKFLIEELNLDKKDTLIFEYYKSRLSKMCENAHYCQLNDFSDLFKTIKDIPFYKEDSIYKNIILYFNVKPDLVLTIVKLIENIDNNFYITVQTYGELSLEEV